MKKFVLALLLAATMAVSASAVSVAYNETSPDNWSTMTYTQVPVYKVLDSREAYVVIYAKNRIGVGKVIIPKKWGAFNGNETRKLKVRNLQRGKVKAFMSIVKKDGEFHHVILSLPVNKSDTTWGILPHGVQLEGLDKETLEEIEL